MTHAGQTAPPRSYARRSSLTTTFGPGFDSPRIHRHMMNADKMLALIELYEQRLAHVQARKARTDAPAGPGKGPEGDGVPGLSLQDQLSHLKWMLPEMREMVHQENAEAWDKVGRWLGFVQGALWALRFYSIDDLREHVKGTND